MDEKVLKAIINEANDIKRKAHFTARAHFIQAEHWGQINLRIGIPSVLMASVAGASALTDSRYGSFIAAVLAIAVAALTAVTTFLKPSEKETIYLKAGNDYDSLRFKSSRFVKVHSQLLGSDKTIAKKLDELADIRDKLNAKHPQVSTWAYKGAKERINRQDKGKKKKKKKTKDGQAVMIESA